MQNRCSTKRILIILWILFLPGLLIFSQDHETKNNYTGAWGTPSSWDPAWPVPQTNVNNLDITINGFITANSSLRFSGASSKLIVDDTLVINGNLTIEDGNDIQVNNSGILIVRGNLIFSEHSRIEANNYIIVTGNITKLGSTNHGQFASDDNPVKVFIGGSISPSSLSITKPNFPVFNCSSPPTTPYSHSGCSYGDITDIITDPIYAFFQSTCTAPTLTSSDSDNSFCQGTSVTFTSGGGTNYNFRVNAISVKNGASPTYTTTALSNGEIVDVIVTGTCTSTSSGITNTVFALPVPSIAGPAAVCAGATGNVYATEAGKSNYLWTVSAGGTIAAGGGTGDNTVSISWTTTGAKTVKVNYTNGNGCTTAVPTTYNITVNPISVPTLAGPATVCAGATGNVYTTEAGMSNYLWTISVGGTITAGGGTGNNTVTVTWTTAGAKTVAVNYKNSSGCIAASPAIFNVIVNSLTVPTAVNNGPVCAGSALSLAGGPAAMTIYSWTGPNGFTSLLQNPSVSDKAAFTMSGIYSLTITNASGCTGIATTSVTINDNPVAFAGPDQELTFLFETQMEAELSPPETGEWSLVSGAGRIKTINSPTTAITELLTGVNIFLWKVQNGSCKSSDEVKITVYELFIPSVITPDGDGKNDYFKISENIGKVELIIFNRWGNEEYRNSNYLNEWDGRNNSGAQLPYDTYFYILKLEKGIIKKGSVLILR